MDQILHTGSRGVAVRLLQNVLVKLGHLRGAADGIFGPLTTMAVRKFQKASRLAVDGVVGPRTWARLAKLAPEAFPHGGSTVLVGGLVMPRRRCYPLRQLADGRAPRVTSGHKTKNPSRPGHNGSDLFYEYLLGQDPPVKSGDGGRAGKWWIPDGTLAVAQADGVVETAGDTPTGFRAWIRHEGGLLTGAFHLTRLVVKAGDVVGMGDPLGVVGDNPRDSDADHLHSELYQGTLSKYPQGTLDPELFWDGAEILPAV